MTGLLGWVVAAGLVPSARAGEPALFLSPVEAMAVIRQRPVEPPPPVPARPLHGPVVPAAPGVDIVPSRFHVPDGYAIDFDRDAPRFAEPVDRDNMVAIELLGPKRYGVGMFIDYDEESFPIGDGGEFFAVRIERLF